MELILFYKSGTKHINIEFYKYNILDSQLEDKIETGIRQYHETVINKYEQRDYDPLSNEKGRNFLEKLDIEETEEQSLIFNVYLRIIKNQELDDCYQDEKEEYNITVNEIDGFHQNESKLSFFVIQDGDKIFFKKVSENSYFLKNRMQIFSHLEEAKLKNINKNLVMIDTNFDFYLQDVNIFIKSSHMFESICHYEQVYEKHRDKVLSRVKNVDIIENFDSFESECNKKTYLRIFKKVESNTELESTLSNKNFIDDMIKQTSYNIKWNKECEKIIVATNQVKTIIHLFSGLIGTDVYDQVVLFNDKLNISN